jgi:sensor histidine kinase YesM
MLKHKLNVILLFEVFINLVFWLILLWLRPGEQIVMISVDIGELTTQEKPLHQSLLLNLFCFYTCYLFIIPKLIKRSIIILVICSLLFILLITELDKMLATGGLFTNEENKFLFVYSISIISHSFFAVSALIIQRSFNTIKHTKQVKEQAESHTKTELNLLKQQIHPHFLFNVLNSLYSSSYQYGDNKTAAGIGQLSDLLRYMLYETNADKVPLNNEVNYLNDYIKLQMLRFSEDVELNFSHTPSYKGINIAPMLLITLVENAFKHGITPQQKNKIEINLSCNNNTITFRVSNPVQGINYKSLNYKDDEMGGVGLTNLKRRLSILYHNKHDMTTTIDNDIFTAELILR